MLRLDATQKKRCLGFDFKFFLFQKAAESILSLLNNPRIVRALDDESKKDEGPFTWNDLWKSTFR